MLSSKHQSRPPHLPPNVRDDRETPLGVGGDGDKYASDLGFLKIRIFLRTGLDMQFSDLPVGRSKTARRATARGVDLAFREAFHRG
jgi:hypothetical protein